LLLLLPVLLLLLLPGCALISAEYQPQPGCM
jgi:hypothetical protein